MYLLYFSLARENRLLALAAAAFWSFSVPVIEEIGDASGDLEGAFWVVLALLLFQRARRSHRSLDWILAGLVMGMAVLSRSALLAGALLLVVGILLERSVGSLRIRLGRAALYALALCVALAPWVIRNQLVFGVPTVGSSLSGYNLYRQNYFAGNPRVPPHYVGAKEADLAIKRLIQSDPPPRSSNELQMDAFYTRAALRDIRTNPARYLELSAFRFLSLWFNSSVKAAYGAHADKLDTLMLIQQILFLGAAAFGAWRHRRTLWPVALVLIAVSAAYILVIAQVRYLVDVMPLVALLAASSFFPRVEGQLA
jgi:4-amino-4-deoxy-L-arabinose transferase-like glycosyltransferase